MKFSTSGLFGVVCVFATYLYFFFNSATTIESDSFDSSKTSINQVEKKFSTSNLNNNNNNNNNNMGNKHQRSFEPPVVMGDESMMSQKGHGTCTKGVQDGLRWNVDQAKADKICTMNRHYAEHSGYAFLTKWLDEAKGMGEGETIEYFDSIHGKPVFTGPVGRTMKEFLIESKAHGWPSFRDDEVQWEDVRVLKDGEVITVDGVHLGHNIPDSKGNRYCINLVCIAGNPE